MTTPPLHYSSNVYVNKNMYMLECFARKTHYRTHDDYTMTTIHPLIAKNYNYNKYILIFRAGVVTEFQTQY